MLCVSVADGVVCSPVLTHKHEIAEVLLALEVVGLLLILAAACALLEPQTVEPRDRRVEPYPAACQLAKTVKLTWPSCRR
jgi:hypothetical protein